MLYTALHHAREPNSASQLIFYMWYLLENYATRADIQAIVNNLEMYFVPCINVDGYIYNETTNPPAAATGARTAATTVTARLAWI